MNVHVTNPLSDGRWDELVARHPRASAFHQRGWLEALNRTYGYEPFVLTTTPPGEPLRNGIVVCRVSSWLTGTRLVSLPFADHCELLTNEVTDYSQFIDWLGAERDRQQLKYVEVRPLLRIQAPANGFQPSGSYCLHELDLSPSLEQIFGALHKDSIQRRIRRAEREYLSYEAGRSGQLVDDFFRLLLITRRRHHLPPQPRIWFKNLFECMGDRTQLRLVRNNGIAIAAILTLQHRSCVVYKYGCSDDRFHKLGGMPFLFWRLIEESKASGAEMIDFGRSDCDNKGLINFKDRFGTTRKLLTYYRYPKKETAETGTNWASQAIRRSFSMLPDAALAAAGRVLYRHIG